MERIKGRVFDAHLHVIDPRFPLIPNQGYLPDPFTVEDYLEKTSALDVRGGAVVSPDLFRASTKATSSMR
jgi:predicted TIM-barrel fold metal-dependent hydrolase